MIDWEKVRYFLAIARSGSLSAASRRLGVSQPTVGRHLDELEAQFNARLFDRLKQGLVLTRAGQHILGLAEDMERTAVSMELRVRNENAAPKGRVRLATTECLAASWLARKLPQMSEHFPSIELETIVGIGFVDLLRGEAEVALRVGKPGSDQLVGRCLGVVSFGLFASGSYLERFGEPSSQRDLAQHRIIDSSGEIAELAQARHLRSVAAGATVALRCNSVITQLQAARQGMGLMAAPTYTTCGDSDLRRVLGDEFDIQLDLWLVTHRDLRQSARIRAIMDFLAEATRDDSTLRGILPHSSAA